MSNNLVMYHTSSETPLVDNQKILGEFFQVCVKTKAFIIGYNVLEIPDQDNHILLSLLMKDDIALKYTIEQFTGIKLVRIEGDMNVGGESG